MWGKPNLRYILLVVFTIRQLTKVQTRGRHWNNAREGRWTMDMSLFQNGKSFHNAINSKMWKSWYKNNVAFDKSDINISCLNPFQKKLCLNKTKQKQFWFG